MGHCIQQCERYCVYLHKNTFNEVRGLEVKGDWETCCKQVLEILEL